jgi:hypothetical protein
MTDAPLLAVAILKARQGGEQALAWLDGRI